MSLGAHGQVLAGLDRHADAAAAVREGLAAIAPFVERHPQAFGRLAGNLAQDHLGYCEKAGVEPDGELLGRVVRALGFDPDSTEPPPADPPSPRAGEGA
jgi:hypothetical protein